ncbi:MAG: hypothetical protein IPP17_22525 [Bacteroidetes bacterium]|nr:hypothetical protein [Bacteroidota bacterium]
MHPSLPRLPNHPKIFTLSAPNEFMPILYQRDRQGFALRLWKLYNKR